MKCLECKSLDLQLTPQMSRLGFGHCKTDPVNAKHMSVSFERECSRFNEVDKATVGKRSIWIAKQTGD